MKVAEAPKSTTATNRIQAKQQPFFNKEGQGGFFSKPKEATPSFFNPTTVQPKLKIGKPNDKYEVEADAMADKVVQKMEQPESKTTGKTAEQLQKKEGEEEVLQHKLEIQRKPIFESNGEQPEANVQAKPLENKGNLGQVSKVSESEEEIQKKEETLESEEEVQTMSMAGGASNPSDDDATIQRASGASAQATPDLQSRLNSSKGGGSPLPSETQSSMGSAFGSDFSGVRTHTGNEAVQMNKDLGAQAFTHGNDIYFNEGKYNTNSTAGQHLLAHELTHTVQQGASKPAIQKAEVAETPIAAEAVLRPNDPLDISHRFELTDAWAKYLDSEHDKGKRKLQVAVKIGNRYSGVIEVAKIGVNIKGKVAKYELVEGSLKRYLDISGWHFLNPMRQAGLDPILVLKSFGDGQQTNGFLSIKSENIPVLGQATGFIDGLNSQLSALGLLGLEKLNIRKGGIENTFENGRLVFQVSAMSTVVDGFLKAGGGLGITGDVFTFNLNTDVDVAGLAQGQFMITRNQDGKLGGKGTIQANIANVQATIMAEYIDGVVTIQGTGQIASEKFTGSITLLVTDTVRSKKMMHAALGTEVMEGEKQAAATPTPKKQVAKTPKNQVLAGWGDVQAVITPWLQGDAKVGIDHEGHITIVGTVAVPNEVKLMEQRGKKQQLFDTEIRAGYGIPLVGQVFLFAGVGMFVKAGFGPLVLKNVGFTGTYSTDPKVLQNFNITGTLGINAFAVLGLEAEAGVGVTLLGHDVKAGVNVTAAAGLRAYAEATPTFEYKESKAPEGGKVGESRLKGHFEAAAQLFLQLSGSLFYELDSPWWSPAPDGRTDFPLGEVQYPIGDSLGIGADVDWLVGSPDTPELKLSPIEFDPNKFTADVMADPPPRKLGNTDANPEGQWKGKGGGNKKKDPKTTGNGRGLPNNGKKKEDLKKLPDQQKYMRALDEMSKLDKVKPKPTHAIVAAKAKKVKAKYRLELIQVRGGANADKAAIYVKHKKENNSKHLLKIPLMNTAEAIKLRAAAMADLRVREKQAVAQDGSMEEAGAQSLVNAWKKAQPIVESAKVVDGKATWDYFIDFGDVSNTEKGITKKGNKIQQVDSKDEGVIGLTARINADGGHDLIIEGTLEKIVLRIHSDPLTINQFINHQRIQVNKLKNKDIESYNKKGIAIKEAILLKKILGKKVATYKKEVNNAYKKEGKKSLITAAHTQVKNTLIQISEKLEIMVVDPKEWISPESRVLKSMVGGKAKRVIAQPLTGVPPKENPGSAATSDPIGWNSIDVSLRKKGSWVRAHLLSHKLHGPGDQLWNLFPGSKEMNLTNMENQVESDAKKRLNSGEILFYNVVLTYGNEGEYDFIPTEVYMQYGKFDHIKNKKKETYKTITFKQAPPNVAAVEINNLNTSSAKNLALVAKNAGFDGMHGFFVKLVKERNKGGSFPKLMPIIKNRLNKRIYYEEGSKVLQTHLDNLEMLLKQEEIII